MANVNLLALQKQADIRSPKELLDHALPMILAAVDGARRATVFRLAQEGLVVWHSVKGTVANGTFVLLEDKSPSKQAIRDKQLIINEQEVLAPLVYQDDVYALLVVHFEDTIDTESVSEICDNLSLLLYTQQIRMQLQQQITITGKLHIATSLVDVATIVAETIAQKQQFIGMNIFEYDASGQVTGARTVATANRHQGYASDIPLNINLTALDELYQLLLSDGEVLVSDIATEDRFSAEAKVWLREQKIQSMYIIPLWIEGQLDAFITLSDTTRALALSPLEKELFHNVAHQAALIIERQRLLDQTKQQALQSSEQVRILRLLNDLIAQANSNQLDKPILQKMADILLEATGVDHVGVVMREGEQVVVVSEAPSDGLVGRSIELGTDSIHTVLEQTRVPFVAVDVANDSLMPKPTRDDLLDANVKSVVIVPMFDESENLLGSVGLDYFTKQSSINPDMVETAQTIVTQIALSLQKVRLLAEAQQKATQLERLTEFGQSLRAYLTVPKILSTTLEYSPDIMQADYVGIMLYDAQSNTLRDNATHILGQNQIHIAANSLQEADNSVAIQAWTTHDIVKIDDLHSDWAWNHKFQRELQSIIALPLSLAGVTLGVLEFGHSEPHHFNDTDVNTLRQIGNQLAIALSNASAYSQSQRLAHNKSQANEIIAKLQEQLEVQKILSVTVNELGEALGAKRGRIRLGVPTQSRGDTEHDA